MVGLIALVAVGLVGIIALVWFFQRGSSSSSSSLDSDIAWRSGDDGFFITGDFAPGVEVQYRCLVNGTWRSGSVAVAGAETFVYTGSRPTDVRILGSTVPSSQWVQSSPPSSSSDVDLDDVPTSFPSAY